MQKSPKRVRFIIIGAGPPEYVARTALIFSCEDSGFTTGTELPVDGGFSWG